MSIDPVKWFGGRGFADKMFRAALIRLLLASKENKKGE